MNKKRLAAIGLIILTVIIAAVAVSIGLQLGKRYFTPSPAVTATPTPVRTVTPTFTVKPAQTTTPAITPTPEVTSTPIVTRTATPRPTITTTPRAAVPPTALTTDEADRVIIGLMLIFVGMLIYRSGLYLSLGNIYWNNGGRKLWGGMVSMNDAFDNSAHNLWNGLVLFDNTVEGAFDKTIYSILNYFIRLINALIYGFAYVVNSVYRIYHKTTTAIEVKILETILKIRVFVAGTQLTLKPLIHLPGKLLRGLLHRIVVNSSHAAKKESFEDSVIRDREAE